MVTTEASVEETDVLEEAMRLQEEAECIMQRIENSPYMHEKKELIDSLDKDMLRRVLSCYVYGC